MSPLYAKERTTYSIKYLQRKMEDFISSKDGGNKFVPLPKWEGITEVPPEFNKVKRKDDGSPWHPEFPDTLKSTSTGLTEVPESFKLPEICNFPVVETLFRNINFWHSFVHGSLGSVMVDGRSPAAPIFWCFHAFLVEIYDKWTTCPRPTVCRTITVRNNRFDDCNGTNLANAPPLTLPSLTQVTFRFGEGFHTVTTDSNTSGGPDIHITNSPGGDVNTDGVTPVPQDRLVTMTGVDGGEIRFHCGIHGATMNGTIRIGEG